MSYEIRYYQEEFLDAQERVGREVTKTWRPFEQTSAEQLKQVYSQPGFDPETRLYCFKDGELIGFLTSTVLGDTDGKANLEFPLVLPGHEKAENLLFEKAVEVLQKKGVKVVRTRVSALWGKTVAMAAQRGYTFAEESAVCYTVDVNTAPLKGLPGLEEVTNYDHERDVDQMVEIFVNEYNMSPEQARSNFDLLEKAGDTVVAHVVIRKGGNIVGRALVLRDDVNPRRAHTGAIYVTEEQQRALLLTRVLHICKEKDIEKLDTTIFGELLSMKDQLAELYTSLGFDHTATIAYYEKEI